MRSYLPRNSSSMRSLPSTCRLSRLFLSHHCRRSFFITTAVGRAAQQGPNDTVIIDNYYDNVISSLNHVLKGIEYERSKGYPNAKGRAAANFHEFLISRLQDPIITRALLGSNNAAQELARIASRYPMQSMQDRKSIVEKVENDLRLAKNALLSQKHQRLREEGIEIPAVNHEAKSKIETIEVKSEEQLSIQQQQQMTTTESLRFATQTLHEQLSSPFTPPTDWAKVVPIVIDLEATGLGTGINNHIVEIAAKSLVSENEFESLIRLPDGTEMNRQTEKVTGLKTAFLRDSELPEFYEVYTNFLGFIDKELEAAGFGAVPLFIGHNIQGFDLKLLISRAREANAPMILHALMLDTLHLARHVHGGTGPPGGYSCKLQALYHYYTGENAAVQHRAMGDIETTITVLNNLLKEKGWHNLSYEELVLEKRPSFSLSQEWAGELLSPKSSLSSAPPPVKRTLGGAKKPTLPPSFDLQIKQQSNVVDTSIDGFALDDFSIQAWAIDDPLAMLDAEAREAEADGMPLIEPNWKQLKETRIPKTFFTTPFSELRGISKAYTKKEQTVMEVEDWRTLQDVLSYYPKGYVSCAPGKLPQLGVEDYQAVKLFAKLKKVVVQQYGRKGLMSLQADFEVLSPQALQQFGIPYAFNNDAEDLEEFAQRQGASIIMRKVLHGTRYMYVLNKEKQQMEMDYSNKLLFLAGQVKPHTFGKFPKQDQWELHTRNGTSIEVVDDALLQALTQQQQRDREVVSSNDVIACYSSKGNLNPEKIQSLVEKGLQFMIERSTMWKDPIPEWILRRYGLLDLSEAYKAMHFPTSGEHYESGRQRLAFQELLALQLKLLIERGLMRVNSKDANGDSRPVGARIADYSLVELAKKSLPFKMTAAQRRVLAAMQEDMSSWPPMMSLLQGDVGCGKTVIAFLALIAAAGSGYQGAIMAPTAILAEQHFKGLQKLLDSMEAIMTGEEGSSSSSLLRIPKIALVTGGKSAKERKEIAHGLEDGSIDIAVGTHALIAENTKFNSLGLVVIDEQHKFGVEQRAALLAKTSSAPHVVSMTATPIPRSVALVLFGEMKQLTIDELPPGRQPIQTKVIIDGDNNNSHQGEGGGRQAMYEHMRAEIASGGQVYIVCPLIEDSTSDAFAGVKAAVAEQQRLVQDGILTEDECGLLHGGQNGEEKEAAIAAFVSGKKPVLVSTTVVEVGVDVSAASIMVIEHADHFGLASLHQLRGRVGRGNRPSTCYLLTDKNTDLPRLQVMERHSSGFKVAEEDFRLRGTGDILGTKQHGNGDVSSLKLYRIPQDAGLVELAREAATLIIEKNREVVAAGEDEEWPLELLAETLDPRVVSQDLLELPTFSNSM